jgi:CheY-like chemotaxis protein
LSRTILIVDDEASVREALREVIEAEGFPTAEASNGGEALAWLRAHEEPCLVLLDLMMPGVSGYDFLDAVKADPALRGVPIVIVSAASREKVEEARRGSTAVAVLPKPVQLAPLLAAIEAGCR